MKPAFLSLGSNIEPRNEYIKEAINLIGASEKINIIRQSKIVNTSPVGVENQPDFLNAVLLIETGFSPRQLLKYILSIENKMGRIRTMKWGPRNIDIDILTYGDEIINEPDLIVPHPELKNRYFFIELINNLK